MIASLETQTAITVPSFESLLPSLQKQVRYACRFLRLWQDRQEAEQEMISLAFSFYRSLVDRDKIESVYSSTLGNYAIRSYFAGRRFTGLSATDISSPRCQLLDRAVVCGLEIHNKTDHRFKEINVYDKRHRPSTIAAFNLDFESWTASLDDRDREILFAILDGETTGELSKRFAISPGRVSQIRQELASSWKNFTADLKHRYDDLIDQLLKEEI